MPVVFVSIGSNLGNRQGNIDQAIKFLVKNKDITVEKVSSVIETLPHKAFGPKYLNGVVKITTELSPKGLLAVLQECEAQMQRVHSFKNSPRTIDLDIILYEDHVINEPDLKIPHPRMLERDFVIKPLLEIEPNLKVKLANPKSKVV